LRAYDIPQASRTAKGQAMVNFLQLAPNEKVSAILSMDDMNKYEYLVMLTTKGTIKKTAIEDFKNVRRSGLIALKLREDDMLEWVRPSSGKNEIMIITAQGQAIRFQEKFPKAPIEIVSTEGTVEIKNLNKLMQKHEFGISATAASRIVDNTLYFPGWKVYVDGVETPIGYQDENWRGLITFPVSAGEHSIKVVFEETRIRKFADALSMISVGILLGLFIKKQNYVYNN